MENKTIIYLLRIFPFQRGELDIDGERFKVYEEIASEYTSFFQENSITEIYLKAFTERFRSAKREGKTPNRYLKVMQTLEEKAERF